MKDISFEGRVAIVTGGGRGLGAAYARELARRGAAVIVHDNGASPDGVGTDAGPAQSVVDEILAAGGCALACVSDASTPVGGGDAVKMATNHYGRLDVVVANAGIIHSNPLSKWTTDRFEDQLQHHLLSAFHVVKPAMDVMRKSGYGRLVFVSSAAGIFGQQGLAGYATAKTGMLGLMNVAALEGAECGITANAVMPMAGTRMASAILGDIGDSPDSRAFLATLRLDQVAPVVAYLASTECTMTSTVLSAFAGRVAQLKIGMTHGWFAPTKSFSAEDVARHMPAISDTSEMFFPGSIFDEMAHTLGHRSIGR